MPLHRDKVSLMKKSATVKDAVADFFVLFLIMEGIYQNFDTTSFCKMKSIQKLAEI